MFNTFKVSAVPPRRSAVITVFRGATAMNGGTTAEPRRSWRCHCCLCRTSTAVAPRLQCDGGVTARTTKYVSRLNVTRSQLFQNYYINTHDIGLASLFLSNYLNKHPLKSERFAKSCLTVMFIPSKSLKAQYNILQGPCLTEPVRLIVGCRNLVSHIK